MHVLCVHGVHLLSGTRSFYKAELKLAINHCMFYYYNGGIYFEWEQNLAVKAVWSGSVYPFTCILKHLHFIILPWFFCDASILFWYILDEHLWVVLYPKTTYRVYYVKIEGSIHTLWFIVLIILLTFLKRNPPQKYMFMHVGVYILFLCNES